MKSMKKVAVFGNAGGGKSNLSKRLAAVTGLPLVALDLIKYKPGGGEVPDEEYKTAHNQLTKRVYHLRSPQNVKAFYQAMA